MSLRATILIIASLLFSGPASAALSSCRFELDRYFYHLERVSWFRTNLEAPDLYFEPFLNTEEQARRLERHQLDAAAFHEELRHFCFVPRFDLHRACVSSWARAIEVTRMIGSALSRTDILNRNPVPNTREWTQMLMDQQQLAARANVRQFRQQRKEILDGMPTECFFGDLPGGTSDRVEFMDSRDEIVSPAVELIRESFLEASETVPAFETLEQYRCRQVHVHGEQIGAVDFAPEVPTLQTFNYRLRAEGPLLVFEPEIQFTFAPTYVFSRDTRRIVATIRTKSDEVLSVAYLRKDQQGRLLLEVLNDERWVPILTPISDPKAGWVFQYWSCVRR